MEERLLCTIFQEKMDSIASWMVLFAFSFLLAAISFSLLRSLLGFGENVGIPGPKGWPYIGILPTFLKSRGRLHLKLQEWEKQYGKMYQFVILGQRWYVTSDASLISKVALARPASYTRRRKVTHVMNEAGFVGLFSAEDEAWVRHRKVTAPAFSSLKVADMQVSMALVVGRLTKLWDDACGDRKVVDAIQDLMRFSLDVIALTSFGLDINALQGSSQVKNDIQFVFRTLGRRIFSPIPTWRYKWLRSSEDRAYEDCWQRLTTLVLAAKEKGGSETQAAGPDNLLKRLLRSAEGEQENGNGEGVKLTDEELVGNILLFFIAGQDTTAITLAWTLFFLATHPKIQAEVHEEVERVCGSEGDVTSGALGAVDTKELKYLTMVIKESMRLKPVGPWISFQSKSTVKIQDGLVLHPNDVFVILAGCMAKSDEFFENPLEFDPRRWEGDARGLGMTLGSAPFGWGQRICPGRFLAFTEMQLCLAAICHRFEITLAPDCPPESVKEIETFTMRPSQVRLSLSRRRE